MERPERAAERRCDASGRGRVHRLLPDEGEVVVDEPDRAVGDVGRAQQRLDSPWRSDRRPGTGSRPRGRWSPAQRELPTERPWTRAAGPPECPRRAGFRAEVAGRLVRTRHHDHEPHRRWPRSCSARTATAGRAARLLASLLLLAFALALLGPSFAACCGGRGHRRPASSWSPCQLARRSCLRGLDLDARLTRQAPKCGAKRPSVRAKVRKSTCVPSGLRRPVVLARPGCPAATGARRWFRRGAGRR